MTVRQALRYGLLFAVLILPATALAQAPAPAPAEPPSPASADLADGDPADATIRALEQEARRLTLLNQLPETLRQDAAALLARADALRARSTELRQATLEAYVRSLREGNAPSVARVEAQQATVDERLQLAQDDAALRADLRAFVAAHPEARALLGWAAERNLSRPERVGPMALRGGPGGPMARFFGRWEQGFGTRLDPRFEPGLDLGGEPGRDAPGMRSRNP